MLREDRLLCAFTLILAAASIAPILTTPFLPLVDLGSHVGVAGLLPDVWLHRGVAWRHYAINPWPVPYWTGYIIMSVLHVLVGPMVAANVTVAIAVLLLPLSYMRLLVALSRSPRAGLWAFLLAWDVNMYWGWFTFQLGMALAFYALAWMIEAQRVRDALRVAPLTALVALTHVHAAALVGVAAVTMALMRPCSRNSLIRHAVALAGFAVMIPWLWAGLARHGAPVAGAPWIFANPPLSEKVGSLYRYSMDVLPQPTAADLTAVAFLLLLLGPTLLGSGRRRTVSPLTTEKAVSILGTCLALYLILPFEISSPVQHWWLYPRYSTYILLGLLLIPTPDLRGLQTWVLAPGIVLSLALSAARFHQFADFGRRTRPYLEIIKAMRPNSTFLPLDFSMDWNGTREWPLGQLHGYAAAAKSSFDPHLFDFPYCPLLYRQDARLPVPSGWQNDQIAAGFSMTGQGRFYDYIITHPRKLDVVARLPPGEVELVVEAGEWRLYEVKKH